MRLALLTIALGVVLATQASPLSAGTTISDDAVPNILGTPQLLLHQKSEGVIVPFDAQAVSPISPGNGYATVSYSIGTDAQRQHLSEWIQYLAESLPNTIGNSDGTYVITLRIKGTNLDIKEPIIAIQWTTTKAFLFFEKTVNDVKNTQWAGTIIDEMPILNANRKLQYSIEISFHKNRSLDFAFLKQASGAAQASSLVSLLPIPAASSVLIGSITDLIGSIYNNATSDSVVDSEEIEVTTSFTKRANLPIKGSNGTFDLPVYLRVDTRMSRLVDGGLTNGKFDKGKISQTLFDDAQIVIAEGKTVRLSELVATANDEKSKKTRSFLDAIQNAGAYSKDDVDIQCANLVSALDTYVSKSDARALFWAFLQLHAGHIDRAKCIGSGTLKPELDALGLTF